MLALNTKTTELESKATARDTLWNSQWLPRPHVLDKNKGWRIYQSNKEKQLAVYQLLQCSLNIFFNNSIWGQDKQGVRTSGDKPFK